MKRLTNQNAEIPLPDSVHATYWALVHEKLARYENAEQEGRLVVLPCKVGDFVWFIAIKQVMYGQCRNISIHSGGMQITLNDTDGEPWTVAARQVFKTQPEAEAAMKGAETDG